MPSLYIDQPVKTAIVIQAPAIVVQLGGNLTVGNRFVTDFPDIVENVFPVIALNLLFGKLRKSLWSVRIVVNDRFVLLSQVIV